MPSLNNNSSVRDYQEFIKAVYGLPNTRNFTTHDMIINVIRFSMRGLKGIRKNDYHKARINLLISLSWFCSLMNQLQIDIEDGVWNRFPYQCSYCGECPCVCKAIKVKKRIKNKKINLNKRPKNISAVQGMHEEIYPSARRTVADAGIHFAEETGELAEAILSFLGNHKGTDFQKIQDEAADFYSCLMDVFNSLKIDLAAELAKMFKNNCHVCHKVPCVCDFNQVLNYRS